MKKKQVSSVTCCWLTLDFDVLIREALENIPDIRKEEGYQLDKVHLWQTSVCHV